MLEKIFDSLTEWGICLPLTLTEKSKNRVVRFIGMFALIFWGLPAVILLAPILIVVGLAEMIQDFVNEANN